MLLLLPAPARRHVRSSRSAPGAGVVYIQRGRAQKGSRQKECLRVKSDLRGEKILPAVAIPRDPPPGRGRILEKVGPYTFTILCEPGERRARITCREITETIIPLPLRHGAPLHHLLLFGRLPGIFAFTPGRHTGRRALEGRLHGLLHRRRDGREPRALRPGGSTEGSARNTREGRARRRAAVSPLHQPAPRRAPLRLPGAAHDASTCVRRLVPVTARADRLRREARVGGHGGASGGGAPLHRQPDARAPRRPLHVSERSALALHLGLPASTPPLAPRRPGDAGRPVARARDGQAAADDPPGGGARGLAASPRPGGPRRLRPRAGRRLIHAAGLAQ